MANCNDNDKESKQRSRMELEAMAQAAMREGLSKEQVAYEQWVDTQPIGEVVAWDEMGDEGRRKWVVEHMGEEVVLGSEARRIVERGEKGCVSAEPTRTPEARQTARPAAQPTARRVWTATSSEDSQVKTSHNVHHALVSSEHGQDVAEDLLASSANTEDFRPNNAKAMIYWSVLGNQDKRSKTEVRTCLKNQTTQQKMKGGGMEVEEEVAVA